METKQLERMNLDDFGTGIIAGLAAEGIKAISVTKLDAKIVAAFDWMEPQAASEGIELRFRVILNKAYQDSPAARVAIRGAVSRGLLSSDNDNTLYIKIHKEDAVSLMENIPGSESLWRNTARQIIDYKPGVKK